MTNKNFKKTLGEVIFDAIIDYDAFLKSGKRLLARDFIDAFVEKNISKFDNEDTKSRQDLIDDLNITTKLFEERDRLLDAIPQCKVHGKCVPYALEWIEEAKKLTKKYYGKQTK